MRPFKDPMVKCPKCGFNYLPAEVYYPDKLLGHPTNIVRSDKGEVISYGGSSMDLTEYFQCEHCGANFKSMGIVKFVPYPQEDLDFDEEEYVTKLAPDKLILNED